MPHSQSIFNLDIETDEIVLDAIRFIWDSLSEKINDNYIGTLEIPFTVKLAVQKINKIVSLATSPHDGSVVQFKLAQKNASEEFLEFMEPDYEPSPSVIDTWARGVVNTKKKLPLKTRALGEPSLVLRIALQVYPVFVLQFRVDRKGPA